MELEKACITNKLWLQKEGNEHLQLLVRIEKFLDVKSWLKNDMSSSELELRIESYKKLGKKQNQQPYNEE